MANISLRAYRREIEDLIGHGRIDEVIAHCRHILKFYPKDVAVYRLLAKAYLESQRYSDATDIFQRVLSVVPDDFVAHVGMSIIREDEGNMDASIWHMERAFESQPSNSAIRDELRRLFGKRDGMEPPKIRLTRGALARMYAQGNLYQQSIGELRAALADEPQRFDLQSLLARMYYMNGQRVEAAEMSNTLISKLPFCLDANRILAEILYDSDRAGEAEVYHQRVKVIDPYAAHATPDNLDTEDIAEDTVTLMRLDWQPGQELSELDSRPGWAASLGLDLGGRGGAEALPSWLSEEDEEEADLDTEDSLDSDFLPFSDEDTQPEQVPADEEVPDPSMDYRDTLPPGETPPEKSPVDSDELIPEWMKDAGWATSTGEVPGEAPVLGEADEPDVEDEAEAIASADIPDWLRDIAPADAPEGGDPGIEADDEMSGEIPSWLSSRPPGPTDSVVMWLQNKPDEQDLPPTTGELEPVDVAEEPEEEVPDWLQSVAASLPPVPTPMEEEAEDEGDAPPVPEPLSDATEIYQMPETEPEPTDEEEFDWMAAVEAPVPDSIEDTKPRQLLAEAEEQHDALRMEAEEEDFSWESEEEVEPASEGLEGEITAIFVPDEEAAAEPAAAEPAGMFDETVIYETEEEAVEGEADIPEWLREMEDEVLAEEPAIGQEPEQAAVEEDVPDWLRGLEEAPEPADLPVSQFDAEVEADLEAVSEPEATPEEDFPDWLREMEATTPSVEAPSLTEMGPPPAFAPPELEEEEEIVPAQTTPAEPVPDWLAEAMTEDQTRGEAARPGDLEEEDQEAEFLSGMPSLEDQDAAIAWLESLAAKKGVAEEELVSDPQARRDTPPDWVTDSMSGFEEDETLEEGEYQQLPREPLPEQPDWMTETLISDTLVADEDELQDEEEELLAEPAVEEWSLDTLEKEEVGFVPEPESEQPLETRQLQAEEFEQPSMPSLEEVAEFAADEAELEPEEDEMETPTFIHPAETRQLDAALLGEEEWLEGELEEVESAAETPDWLDKMGEDVEAGEAFPQPATTRELDFEPFGRAEERAIPYEVEEEVEAAEEAEEAEPEWMRETGIPEAAFAAEAASEEADQEPAIEAEEAEDAIPEWMRDTGMPDVIFEAEAEAELEEEVQEEEPEMEWLLETALPESGIEGEPAPAAAVEEPVTTPPDTEEDWMLETALPDELQTALEGQPEVEYAPTEAVPVQPIVEPVRPDAANRFEEMLAEAQSALAKDDISAALGKYTRLIRRRQQLDTIIADLEEAIYRHPVDTDILETLGDAFVKSNSLQAALDTYSKAEDLLRS